MRRIGIVVVTYNRIECLKKNIECIKKLKKLDDVKYEVFFVNNASTDGTDEFLNDIINENKNFHVIKMNENTGGSGGFAKGIQYAYEHNVDFVFGMDDDAYVSENCLIELLNKYDNLKEDSCLFANSNNDIDNFVNGIKKVKNWMFVGFFIPKNIIEKVGGSRSDFFIYHDDTEYAYRIRKAGFNIYKVQNAVIEHRIGGAKMLPSRRLGPFSISFYDFPDWKCYYYIRNNILKYTKWNYRYYLSIIKCFFIVLKITYVNPKQKTIAWQGFCDGINGISGPTIKP